MCNKATEIATNETVPSAIKLETNVRYECGMGFIVKFLTWKDIVAQTSA
jgi:hypothetical protein